MFKINTVLGIPAPLQPYGRAHMPRRTIDPSSFVVFVVFTKGKEDRGRRECEWGEIEDDIALANERWAGQGIKYQALK